MLFIGLPAVRKIHFSTTPDKYFVCSIILVKHLLLGKGAITRAAPTDGLVFYHFRKNPFGDYVE